MSEKKQEAPCASSYADGSHYNEEATKDAGMLEDGECIGCGRRFDAKGNPKGSLTGRKTWAVSSLRPADGTCQRDGC